MPKRKTVSVSWIKEKVNYYLENSKSTPDQRQAVASLLDTILYETGNYRGFNYLAWLRGGVDQWRNDGMPKNNEKYLGDQTRIVFY